MTRQIIVNGRVLTNEGFADDRAVVIEDGWIKDIVPLDQLGEGDETVNIDGAYLTPGFIDTQVNGGADVLFNDDPSVAAIEAIGRAHRRFGTTGFLPTLISDDLDIVKRGIAAVDAAIEAGVPGVLGIHIEGPFLNVDRKGIHDASKIRAFDETGFAVVTALKHGRTLLTLAPEQTTPDWIEKLVAHGVIVAAGHTNGEYEDIVAALDHGVTGFTHLFNAMSPLTARKPGAVGAALLHPSSWCGLIVDGRHIASPTIQVALACKPLDRFMLVTDAMPGVGSDRKEFMLQGQRVTVVDGVCINAEGKLAGSDLDMISAVRNSSTMLGLSLEQSVRMASDHPAQFLSIADERGTIAPGRRSDLVAFGDDFAVTHSWIGADHQSY